MVIFLFTIAVFVIYDLTVRARQLAVMERLIKEDKIISDIFPANVRDRMYENGDHSFSETCTSSTGSSAAISKRHVEMFSVHVNNPHIFKSAPIADLYLHSTVFYADIEGMYIFVKDRVESKCWI